MIELAPIFGNGMILQRERPVSIWGKDDRAGSVSVLFEGKTYTAPVTGGKFLITLPAHPVAKDLSLQVRGSETIELTDVCFGDVFYLAGQSNMELPVSRTLDVSKEEVDASDYPYIRQYRVTPQYNMAEDEIADLAKNPWTAAVPGRIGEMSAAGFYFARRIYDEKQIPIGLVLGAQGGSTIESWMPEELLSKFGDYKEKMAPFMGKDALNEYLKFRDSSIASWRNALSSEDDEKMNKEIPEDATDFSVPGMLRKEDGTGFIGIVWFYKEFTLEDVPSSDAFLYLGDLIDADQTFINGTLVGRTEYRYPPRKYPFDGSILRKGRNLIAVRLIIETGDGGFVAEHPYYVRSGDEKIELSGTWKMAFGKEAASAVPAFLMGQEVPTSLYKTSVRPLKDYSFRGLLWYQGEANSSDPERYSEKFSAMIRNWRDLFGQKLPLICVEMADYTDPVTGKTPPGWDLIQSQQKEAEKTVPDCAVVSAKDLSTPLELHPQRKSELGARLAEAAKKIFY
ncbi:MAG: hypothetical protein IKZ90_00185 [Clostridiales bacterium]|nr:hypothetical protein [Clostridiales bacterium]